MIFEMGKFCSISDLILCVKQKKEDDVSYMVYVRGDVGVLSADSIVYVGDLPDFDDNDEEIFPPDVTSLNLEVCCMQEQLQDVVYLAYKQKPTASIDEVVTCLNYYLEFDDFLDLV
jgi:hypothetical protein